MKSQEVAVQSVVNIRLASDTQNIDEIVVTAMGISKEKKALGYAVQDVKGDELTKASSTNLANALQGKVSGVDITPSSGMPGASSKITIRGSRSFTGNNTPLYVVDGMPITSTSDVDTDVMNNGSVSGTDYANRTLAALDGNHVVGERDAALVGTLRHGETVAENIAVGIFDREIDRRRAGFPRGIGGRGEGDQPPAGQRYLRLARFRIVGMIRDVRNPRIALRCVGHGRHDLAEQFVGQVGLEGRRTFIGAVGKGQVFRQENQFGSGDSRLLNHGNGLFEPRTAQYDPDRTGQPGIVGAVEMNGRNAAARGAAECRPCRFGGELCGPRTRAVDRDGEPGGRGVDRIFVRIDAQVVTLLESVGARNREESRERQYQVVDSFHRFWFL